MGKYFIFCAIDGDKQPSVKNQFNVSGYPTVVFTDASGKEVHRSVGYKPLSAFIAEMDKARAN